MNCKGNRTDTSVFENGAARHRHKMGLTQSMCLKESG